MTASGKHRSLGATLLSRHLAVRKIYCLVGVLLVNAWVCADGQHREWVWISGSSTQPGTGGGLPGVYGTLGVPAPENIPGGRRAASNWIDSDGNLWLFGGIGYDETLGQEGDLNDLWEFRPSIGEWTWMGGKDSILVRYGSEPGVYGMQGVPSARNIPGGRESANSWTDARGHFWLLGGIGCDSACTSGYLNDLWEFDPATREWTWVSGNSKLPGMSNTGWPGVYGKLGTSSAANYPGSRVWASTWTDAEGSLWLFGGWGYDASGTHGLLNDLWKFDPLTLKWTWVGGSNTIPNADNGFGGVAGVYGKLGVPDASNTPGGRYSASAWTDADGNLWLFGGAGYDSTGKLLCTANTLCSLNDLWKFNSVSREWTWIGGDSAVPPDHYGVSGTYGTLGVFGPANMPGGRIGSYSWVDKGGNFWLFGGYGPGANGLPGDLDDLWKFDPSTHEWAWMSGSRTVVPNAPAGNWGRRGVYGALGIPAPTDTPGGREWANAWTDREGNFWLFGGLGYDARGEAGDLNDLWEQGRVVSAPILSPLAGKYVGTQTLKISDSLTGASIYYTTDGSTPSTASKRYTKPLKISETTVITARAEAADYIGSALASAAYAIRQPTEIVWPTPAQIVYGTALGGNQLNASAVVIGTKIPVTGTFTYTPNVGVVLAAGKHTLSVTFTPDDRTAHESASKSVEITVTKAPLTVAANNETMIQGAAVPSLTYTITGFLLGQTAEVVTGKPLLTTSATNFSAVGNYAIDVSVTGMSAANYRFVPKDGVLTITQ